MERGGVGEDQRRTLGRWIEEWLEHKRASDALKRRTLESYESLLRLHVAPRLGNVRLSALRTIDVQRMCDSLLSNGRRARGHEGEALSTSTVQRIHRALSLCLKHGVRVGLMQRNVAEDVELPKSRKKKARALAFEQAMRLVNSARETRLYLVILIAVTTGMRRGEVLGLRWSDINSEQRTITLLRQLGRGTVFENVKRDGDRGIPIPHFLVDGLKQHSSSGELLFCKEGKPWNPDSISTLYRAITKRAGLYPLRFHDLRHSAGSILLAAGVPIAAVAEILGHKDPSTLLRIYAHAFESDKSAAARSLDDLYSGLSPNNSRDGETRVASL